MLHVYFCRYYTENEIKTRKKNQNKEKLNANTHTHKIGR